jgi:hypothetical protein
MATQLCQKCKQAHPGRVCDYDEKGECAETLGANEFTKTCNEPKEDEQEAGECEVETEQTNGTHGF